MYGSSHLFLLGSHHRCKNCLLPKLLQLSLWTLLKEAEVIIIDRDLHLLRRTDARYHVAHISTRAGIEAVRQAKAEGLAVTADTSPPYFLLNELAISTYNTAFKLSPPLRS